MLNAQTTVVTEPPGRDMFSLPEEFAEEDSGRYTAPVQGRSAHIVPPTRRQHVRSEF